MGYRDELCLFLIICQASMHVNMQHEPGAILDDKNQQVTNYDQVTQVKASP